MMKKKAKFMFANTVQGTDGKMKLGEQLE